MSHDEKAESKDQAKTGDTSKQTVASPDITNNAHLHDKEGKQNGVTQKQLKDDEIVHAFLNSHRNEKEDDNQQPPLKSPDTVVEDTSNDANGDHTQPSKLTENASNEEIDESTGAPRKNRNRRKFGMGGRRQQGANGLNEHPSSRLVGEYQIGNTIGRGSFGNTHMGVSVNSNVNVVLKQLDCKKVPKEYHEVLKKEIQTLTSLNHPHIIHYQTVVVDEDAYVVMEHMENGSVSDIIQKYGPLPEPLVAKYISQVLSALTTLHEHNIVHRNLKCSNLLLKNGELKLTDFAVAVRDEDRRYVLIGSPYWMAPEVLEMNAHITCAADIWSIGCLIIEMLTGLPPHRNLSPMAALLQIVKDGSVPLPDGLATELQDFLSHCFQQDPKKRKDAKFLKSHIWVLKHENAKKEISDYAPRQPTTPQGQAAPEDQKATLVLDVLSDKDKDDIALAELLQAPAADGASPPTVQESFTFHKSSTVPHTDSSSVEALKKEIEALRKLNDDNVASATELKNHMELLVADQHRLSSLTLRQVKRSESAEEQLRSVARTTAHSNMLLKRTNQLATDAVTKNNIVAHNIKKVEEVILEGDSGAKKLATLLYKKLYTDTLSNTSLTGFLAYSPNVKQWKEKKGWCVIKDNFLMIFKSEKGGTAPSEIIYLGEGARLSPMSEDQCKRKHCFKLGDSLLLAADNAEQCSEWMLALSSPQKWWESSEDTPKVRTRDEAAQDKDKTKKSKEDSPNIGNSNGVSKDKATSPTMSPRPAAETQIFGVSLEDLFAREGGNVPTFYSDMINYLQNTALHEEGILRLSGGLSEINAMRAILQKGELIDYTNHDCNAVAGLLKCFFRELPEPLIPEPYHTETLNIMSNSELPDEQRIVELKSLLDQLPPENYAIFQILMNFLVQVNMASDKNKMTVQNLITCMVPTLRCVPGVFMYVIPNYDYIFGNWAEQAPAQS